MGDAAKSPPKLDREQVVFKFLDDLNLLSNIRIAMTSKTWCPENKSNAGCEFVNEDGVLLIADEDDLSLEGAKIFIHEALNDTMIFLSKLSS